MLCFIEEKQMGENVAGPKARDDINHILQNNGLRKIPLNYILDMTSHSLKRSWMQKLTDNLRLRKAWKHALGHLQQGDQVILQFPILRHPIFFSALIKKAKKKNVMIILLIHDLEILRNFSGPMISSIKKILLIREEKNTLNASDYLIVHNGKMKGRLQKMGIASERMISLDIFDYLVPEEVENKREVPKNISLSGPVVIAGNLNPRKTGYLNFLPEKQAFSLFGVGYEKQKGKNNIHYWGSYPPDELPSVLSGSFGLVWDGPSGESCTGVYGEYMQINNPHKTSLYLTAGLPVLVWRHAAVADFVTAHHCGLLIDSLSDIPDVLNSLSQTAYTEMKKRAEEQSILLRSGWYTMQAVRKICRNSNVLS